MYTANNFFRNAYILLKFLSIPIGMLYNIVYHCQDIYKPTKADDMYSE